MQQSEQSGQEQNPIDIVITSYHRPEFTRKCVEHIRDFTTTPHRVIVIDNGSDQETLDTLWDLKDAGSIDVLILLDANIGLEPAKNMTLSFIKSDLYVDTDNDILVPPPVEVPNELLKDSNGMPMVTTQDWLLRLKILMANHEDYAAIACSPQVFIGAHKAELFRDAPEVKEWDKAGGSMRMMRTNLVREVGGWRSNPKDMTEANRREEWYICTRLREKGYKVGYARDIEVFHMFGEDKEWGYGPDVPHYHRNVTPRPVDSTIMTYEEWKDRKNL